MDADADAGAGGFPLDIDRNLSPHEDGVKTATNDHVGPRTVNLTPADVYLGRAPLTHTALCLKSFDDRQSRLFI